MKILVSTLFVALSLVGWSQTKVSVSDGDWNNPQNWNPASVPLNEDTLIINHEIDYFGNLAVNANLVIIGQSGILYGDAVLSLNHSLQIDGELVGDTVVVGGAGGDYFVNNGYLEANQFVASTPINTNNGYMDILGVLVNPEPFINSSTGVMETLDVVTSSDADFENNGVVYIEDWTNEGTVFGTGSFCIENCFQNLGNINGTLDVCDANPGAGLPCDFDIGTIASTVTMCTNGPCSGAAGIDNSDQDVQLNIYPNPSNTGIIYIQSDIPVQGIRILDLLGREVLQESTSFTSLDLSGLRKGNYWMIVSTENRKVVRQISLNH